MSDKRERWRAMRKEAIHYLRMGPLRWDAISTKLYYTFREEPDEDMVMGPALDQYEVEKDSQGYYRIPEEAA